MAGGPRPPAAGAEGGRPQHCPTGEGTEQRRENLKRGRKQEAEPASVLSDQTWGGVQKF